MALVLAAMGLFVYVRVADTLLRDVDQNLRAQAAESAARVADGESVLDPEPSPTPAIRQLLSPSGAVLASTSRGVGPLLRGRDLASARRGSSDLRSGSIEGVAGKWRILTRSVRLQSGPATLVLAASLDQRDRTLVHEFVIGGLAALLLAVGAGYALAVGALRPVEAMRRRAAAITGRTPGSRLPVPPAKDDLSRLARTLNDMLARLAAALEHERRFVDDASHELRTPLALLRTEVEIALRQPRSQAELEQALRSVAEETERLSQLAEDLLLIARSDNGELPIRRERVSAEELMSTVAKRFALRALEHDSSVTVEAAPGMMLDADGVRVEQALGNLVENALMHGAGTVLLAARVEGDGVELSVSDEGAGFPPDFAEQAFDRFSRADEARSHGGSGLGLAIVDLITRAHGGRAEVRNREGGGAVVSIWLPTAVNEPKAVEPAAKLGAT
jgi:signal transduction histidine kinase